jgi:uncharacterized protein (TIGR03435 family)
MASLFGIIFATCVGTPQAGQVEVTHRFLRRGGFSKMLLAVLDRPVINKTGITGRFDIRVEFSREGTKMAGMQLMRDGAPAPASDPTDAPSIFTAFQEQLGLKFEPGKGPVESIVIDHIERPSEN